MTPASDAVVLVEQHNCVRVLHLNRPATRNAINWELSDLLADEIARADADPGTSVIVLSGGNHGFSSGMDLADYERNGVPPSLHGLLARGARKPMVAAVERFAVAGGLELAARCDIIVASRTARFGLPEARVGLVAWYAAVRLPDLLPRTLVNQMIMTGEQIDAERAFEHGLVTRLVEDGQALDAALDLACRIGANAPLSLQVSKDLIGLRDITLDRDLLNSIHERAQVVYDSHDSRLGASAFLQKSVPKWTGS